MPVIRCKTCGEELEHYEELRYRECLPCEAKRKFWIGLIIFVISIGALIIL